MERLEQVMGVVAQYAPPAVVHNLEKRIKDIMQEQKQETVFYTREGVYEYLYSSGTLARPY